MSVLSSLSDLLIAITTRFATRTRGRVTTTSNHTTVVSHCSDQLLGYELSDAWGEAGIGEIQRSVSQVLCTIRFSYLRLKISFRPQPIPFLFYGCPNKWASPVHI